jgi:hypothetical protein
METEADGWVGGDMSVRRNTQAGTVPNELASGHHLKRVKHERWQDTRRIAARYANEPTVANQKSTEGKGIRKRWHFLRASLLINHFYRHQIIYSSWYKELLLSLCTR